MSLHPQLIVGFVKGRAPKTYYVDNTLGNDNNPGNSQSYPWKTIAKVNASSFGYGDRVLFKCGEIWYEELTVPANHLYFGKYGSGAKPVISAAQIISIGAGWVGPDGNGEYSYSLGMLQSTGSEVVRGQPSGYSTYIRLEQGTKGALAADTYQILNNLGEKIIWMKPPVGHTPGEYEYSVSVRVSAITSLKHNVYFDSIVALSSYFTGQGVFNVRGAHNTLNNCEEYFGYFFGFFTDAEHTTFINCISKYNASTGFHLAVGSTNSRVSYSTSTNNGALLRDTANDRDGISIQSDYAMVDHNTVGDNGRIPIIGNQGHEISIFQCGHGTIRNNYIYNAARCAISMGASDVVHDWKIIYNTINRWGLANEASTIYSCAIRPTGYGATAESGHHIICNNTIYSPDNYVLYGIGLSMSTASDHAYDSIIANNIISMPGNAQANSRCIRINRNTIEGSFIDNNDCNGPATLYEHAGSNYATSALYAASPYNRQIDGIDLDPQFTTPGSDFTLQAGSPAIDGGIEVVGITEAYLGAAPDCGANEKA